MNGILLSTTNNTLVGGISAIIGCIICVAIIFFIYKKYKSNPNGEEQLNEFLHKIQNIAKKHIIEAIEAIDINNIKEDFMIYQAQLFEGIYNDIYDLCLEELEKVEDDITVAIIKKVLSREKIEQYVLTIIEDNDIQDKLTDLCNIAIRDTVDRIEAEDAEAAAEAEIYEKGEDNSEPVEELNPTDVVDPFVEKKEETIIPPVEEESDTIIDDGSIEVLEETDISEEL